MPLVDIQLMTEVLEDCKPERMVLESGPTLTRGFSKIIWQAISRGSTPRAGILTSSTKPIC